MLMTVVTKYQPKMMNNGNGNDDEETVTMTKIGEVLHFTLVKAQIFEIFLDKNIMIRIAQNAI